MNIKELLAKKPKAIHSAVKPEVMANWDSGARAESDDETIGIYGVIGDAWDDGMTASRMAGLLRYIGDKPVTVVINSPGGDVFEGIAIYNLLKEHSKPVTVKIVGIAASAASIIALAGDKVEIAKSAFFMIHNAWTIALGNRHDMREVADFLEPFDSAMAEVYADFSGLGIEEIIDMMDSETYITGTEAIEKGFATDLLPSDKESRSNEDIKSLSAVASLNKIMADAGVSPEARGRIRKDFAKGDNPEAEKLGASLGETESIMARITKKAALDKLALVVSKLDEGNNYE